MLIRQYRKNGLDFVLLENAYIRTQLLPQWGGKMVELLYKDLKTQFLLEPTVGYCKTMLPYYGTIYKNYFRTGFDEFFPTILASEYSAGEKEATYFPEHGELWSIPWKLHISDKSIILSVRGVRAAYEMRKRITLFERTIQFNYTVYNLTNKDFYYVWAANLLLKIQSGSQIILPEHVQNVFLDWTTDSTICGQGDYLRWPHLIKGKETNYAIVQKPERDFAVKLYVKTLSEANYGFYRADKGASLLLKLDAKEIPYLGIWLYYSGDLNNQDTIAFQPSNARTESLDSAIKRNGCTKIEGMQAKEWTFEVCLSEN